MQVFARAAVVCALTGALAAPPAKAWGPTGHRVIAIIAEHRLSPEVRARVTKLLLDGQFTMAQISTCPDALRAGERGPLRPEDEYCLKIAPVPSGSAPWHYIDIPVPEAGKKLDAYCPDGKCVTAKIVAFRDVLANSTDDGKRREALMYLVHFMGDIHQPLHCAERQCDQGGNQEHVDVYLKTGERPDHRLHSAWDSDLVDRLMQERKIPDEPALAKWLESGIKRRKARKWMGASVDDIAWASWGLAKTVVYRDIPEHDYCDPASRAQKPEITDLSTEYEDAGDGVIREQLMKAGVRLAELLESNLTR